MGLPGSEGSLTIGWAVSTQYQRVTDRRTDRQPISITCAVWLTHVKNQNGLNSNRQTWRRDSPSRYLTHQWILGQKIKGQRSQGHKVHNVTARQPCGTVSLRLCHLATRRSRTAVSSRDNTTSQNCLTQGDRVIGVSYAIYRVPTL